LSRRRKAWPETRSLLETRVTTVNVGTSVTVGRSHLKKQNLRVIMAGESRPQSLHLLARGRVV